MNVRSARDGERAAARSVCEAALLRVPADPEWLVAVGETRRVPNGSGTRGDPRAADGRVLGALALDGDEIAAVAVRPGRRGRGIGPALTEAAAERRDRLVAEFDPRVRPFYEALGFEIEPAGGDRYRGVRE